MAIYMKVPFTTGSVTAKGYEQWIHLDGIQMGVDRSISMETGSLKARGGGVPRFTTFSISKAVEDASPGIFDQTVHGQIGHTIEIAVVEAGDAPKEFVRYKLEDAMICTYDVSASGEIPYEHLTLSYSKIEVAFTPHDTANRGSTPIRVPYDLSKSE